VHKLFRPAIAVDADTFYAMGWEVGQTNGVATVSHVGTAPQFWSRMLLHPGDGQEDGWGIVTLLNLRALQQGPRMFGLADGVARMLQGNPAPGRIANPVMFLYGGIMALAVVEVCGIGWSALVLRRWWQQPARRPNAGWRSTLRHLALPLVLHTLLAALFLVVLPRLYQAPMSFIRSHDPDVGYAALVTGGLALGWGIVRTVFVLALLWWQGPDRRAAIALPA
jgi:hypothetical protein